MHILSKQQQLGCHVIFIFQLQTFKVMAQLLKKIFVQQIFEVTDPPKQCAVGNKVVKFYSQNIPGFSVDTNAQQFIRKNLELKKHKKYDMWKSNRS